MALRAAAATADVMVVAEPQRTLPLGVLRVPCTLVDAILRNHAQELLPEGQILDYFVQLCLAMEHVHSRRILHRDRGGHLSPRCDPP